MAEYGERMWRYKTIEYSIILMDQGNGEYTLVGIEGIQPFSKLFKLLYDNEKR